MKIYLDSCSLQRPLDTKSHPRIVVESEAVLAILDLCKTDECELISSEALLFETRRIPQATRRDCVLELLEEVDLHVETSDTIEARSRAFIGHGIQPLDALHLASAIDIEADYFCTCDDRFLKKAKKLNTAPTKVVSPLELVTEIDP